MNSNDEVSAYGLARMRFFTSSTFRCSRSRPVSPRGFLDSSGVTPVAKRLAESGFRVYAGEVSPACKKEVTSEDVVETAEVADVDEDPDVVVVVVAAADNNDDAEMAERAR